MKRGDGTEVLTAIQKRTDLRDDLNMNGYLLAHGALIGRDTDDARALLRIASDALDSGTQVPPVVAYYLAHCLRAILGGTNPSQALNLKANARKALDPILEMRTYFRIVYLSQTLPDKTAAIRQYAIEQSITEAAAVKRYAKARPYDSPSW